MSMFKDACKMQNYYFSHHDVLTLLARGPSLYVNGDRLYTSKSTVSRRQVLTYKDDPRAERI